jgi:hypothetical protein
MRVAEIAAGTSGTSLPRSRKLLCGVYAAVALVALVDTWSQNVSYVRPEEGAILGFVLATARFWPETLETPASTSLTVDLGLLLLPLFALMIIESRRLAIRFVWASGPYQLKVTGEHQALNYGLGRSNGTAWLHVSNRSAARCSVCSSRSASRVRCS